MAKLPEELFDTGYPGQERKYFFLGLDEKLNYVQLNFGDKLSHKKCVLDGANLVIYDGDPYPTIECPVCKNCFLKDSESTAKDLSEGFIPEKEQELQRLREKANYLEKVLFLAKNSNNPIKKANLQNDAYNFPDIKEEPLNTL